MKRAVGAFGSVLIVLRTANGFLRVREIGEI